MKSSEARKTWARRPRASLAYGLRRTPGGRVNSEGFRGFKSPPTRARVGMPATSAESPLMKLKNSWVGKPNSAV